MVVVNDIKPCPFCGEEKDFDLTKSTSDREGVPVALICCNCGCSGPWTYVENKEATFNEYFTVAIKYWNERS